jgi:hypothetical protein
MLIALFLTILLTLKNLWRNMCNGFIRIKAKKRVIRMLRETSLSYYRIRPESSPFPGRGILRQLSQ